jgi:phospholipase/carboxylesterase
VVSPRAPLTLGGPGYHWYVVPRVGFPDPDTFHAAYRQLAEFHDQTWERLDLEPARTVLGGFSMGSVMSYAVGLGPGRPVPAGLLAFSGFVPVVEGWQPDVPRPTRVFIAHGSADPIMEVGFAHRARSLLEEAGMDVEYHESDHGHWIEPAHLAAAALWVADTLP